jgi:hypothetical protein
VASALILTAPVWSADDLILPAAGSAPPHSSEEDGSAASFPTSPVRGPGS